MVVSASVLHKLVVLFQVASKPTAALVVCVRTTDATDNERQLQYHVLSDVWLYNTRRRHSALDRRTPDAVYFDQASRDLAA